MTRRTTRSTASSSRYEGWPNSTAAGRAYKLVVSGDANWRREAKGAFGNISRKWMIPLLEYYDKIGATRRDGNTRRLTNRGLAMVEGGIDVV